MKVNSATLKTAILTLCIVTSLVATPFASVDDLSELESSFQDFHSTYIREIKSGNTEFLRSVHPKLPEEIYSFFIGITLDMMKHANDEGLGPAVTCREYNICKATWPQPGGSWAAQTFILHEGKWQWLAY